MRSSDRQRLRERYAFRCGYCGISETDADSLLTTDHFQPTSQGGSDTNENFVYACHTCNEFKGEWWNPADERRILHPQQDPIGEHIAVEPDSTLKGLTVTGVFHIERLHLNRPQLVAHRRERLIREQRALHEADALERLSRLERQVTHLETLVEHLRGQDN
jgi:hypothetical protein